jgi:hypothetical protein
MSVTVGIEAGSGAVVKPPVGWTAEGGGWA